MMATCSDGVLMIFLFSMCLSSQIKFAIYGIPSFLLCIQLLFMELKILQFIDHQYKDNHRMFYVKVLGTMVVFYALTYFVSLDGWVFIIYSCSILFPQIYRNYVVGHKMKSDLQKFFMFSLPRYTLLVIFILYSYIWEHLSTMCLTLNLIILLLWPYCAWYWFRCSYCWLKRNMEWGLSCLNLCILHNLSTLWTNHKHKTKIVLFAWFLCENSRHKWT